MKFTKKETAILEKICNGTNDLLHIAITASETKCYVKYIGYAEKRISKKEAKKLIGEQAYLSGLARSAYHRTAAQPIEKNGKYLGSVYFDAEKFFDKTP